MYEGIGIMHKIKIKKQNIPILLCCIGIFLFPSILRGQLLGSMGQVNVIACFAWFYGTAHKILVLPGRSKKSFGSLVFAACYLVGASFLLFYVKGNDWSAIRRTLLLFMYVFPAFFICSTIDGKLAETYSRIWLDILRVICITMCIFWAFDRLTSNLVQKLWVNLYESNTLLFLLKSGRFVSYYGHPLENSSVFLMLLVWTTISKDELTSKKRLYILDTTIAMFGLAICGSKSGILLAIMVLLLCNVGLKKMKYMIAILIASLALYLSGAFDMVISRILSGLAAGDLSTGRNTALKYLVLNGTVRFDWLKGHELQYDNPVLIAALEYPFLLWAFTGGIVFTIVQYLMYFVKPGIQVLKSKRWSCLICLLALMAFYNSNNGIASFNDDLLIYSINAWLICQITAKKRRKERK